MAQLTDNDYADIARSMLDMGDASPSDEKTFRSFFGAPISVINLVWTRILLKQALAANAHPKHLLWSLLFLKCYSSDK